MVSHNSKRRLKLATVVILMPHCQQLVYMYVKLYSYEVCSCKRMSLCASYDCMHSDDRNALYKRLDIPAASELIMLTMCLQCTTTATELPAVFCLGRFCRAGRPAFFRKLK